MAYFFSAKNLAAYPLEFIADYEAAGTWPDDAVEISQGDFESFFLASAPAGKMLGAKGGRPAWVSIPVDVASLASSARAKRDSLLRDVYDVGVIRLRREERAGADVSAKLAELDAFAILLLNVPQQPGFPTTITWPEEPNHDE